MHLGNGAITPECAALTYGAAAAGLSMSAAGLRMSRPSAEKLQLAAGLGCAIFAAQAINVPIAAGTSAHLVGGVLLAWTLGPALGAWTMAIVLAIQALALGDGGIAALGANVLNMALVPAGIVALVRRMSVLNAGKTQSVGGCVLTQSVGTRKLPLALGAAAGLAVVLAAVLIVGETAAFRSASELASWSEFAARMVGYHLWVGVLEGVATAGIVGVAYAAARRELLLPRFAIALAAAVVLAAFMLPISSSLPDGYEAAAQASGVEWLLAE